MPKEMTKAQIIRAIRTKGAKANPMVKRVAFSGLSHRTKPELRSQLRKMRVTKDGDIRY